MVADCNLLSVLWSLNFAFQLSWVKIKFINPLTLGISCLTWWGGGEDAFLSWSTPAPLLREDLLLDTASGSLRTSILSRSLSLSVSDLSLILDTTTYYCGFIQLISFLSLMQIVLWFSWQCQTKHFTFNAECQHFICMFLVVFSSFLAASSIYESLLVVSSPVWSHLLTQPGTMGYSRQSPVSTNTLVSVRWLVTDWLHDTSFEAGARGSLQAIQY